MRKFAQKRKCGDLGNQGIARDKGGLKIIACESTWAQPRDPRSSLYRVVSVATQVFAGPGMSELGNKKNKKSSSTPLPRLGRSNVAEPRRS